VSAHDNEYHDNMVAMLELIWGEGYMAPGGSGNIARLLDGTEPAGKLILDVGCGIGGPAFEMARAHGARVIGIDLEAPLIKRAEQAAARHGLEDQCQFQTVEKGPLPFDNESFDIVLSSGALTQTSGTPDLIRECSRVLRPGGFLTCYEWMRTAQEYSEDMLYWFRMEELTFELQTLSEFHNMYEDAGFVDIATSDASGWYRTESRREYEMIKGDLYPRMVELLGRESADHFVEDWRSMVVVCESGEMRQGYCRGRKPL
jgi:phosphoethanolamine N-methyltransferase